ncbi:hypothetical protein ACIBHY_34760 [Nonomuraea sp. NPDC050547]|uniref:hypothetical protein n=1 Tax=Nonomuraea sp. NPDC050547 TaxID=3364368 RepID=UPI0037A2B430
MKRVALFAALGGIALCMGLYLVMSSWAGTTLEVRGELVQQMRRIGNVKAEATSRFTEADSIVVTKYLILDIDGSTIDEVMGKALNSPELRSWAVESDRSPSWVQLRSRSWANTLLTLEPLKGRPVDAVSSVELREAIAASLKRARNTDKLLIVSLRRTDTT